VGDYVLRYTLQGPAGSTAPAAAVLPCLSGSTAVPGVTAVGGNYGLGTDITVGATVGGTYIVCTVRAPQKMLSWVADGPASCVLPTRQHGHQ
jgi:hypothetical protein